jgi:hypothetical protein
MLRDMRTESTRPGLQPQWIAAPWIALRREEPPRRRGTGPGIERWILSLLREVGHEARRAPELVHANVALRDLAW